MSSLKAVKKPSVVYEYPPLVTEDEKPISPRPTKNMQAAAMRDFAAAKERRAGARTRPRRTRYSRFNGKRRFVDAMTDNHPDFATYNPRCLVYSITFCYCVVIIGLALSALASSPLIRHHTGAEDALHNVTLH